MRAADRSPSREKLSDADLDQLLELERVERERLYRESEMAVFAASGLPATGLLRPLALFGVPLAIAIALIAFWLAPAAVRQAQSLQEEASRSLIIAGLEPGRFVEEGEPLMDLG